MPAKIIFITGTDTGVGKTLLTALLLAHLRGSGCKALAMKPFCSGTVSGLSDVEVLRQLQADELEPHQINPFFFPEGLAPLVAARRHNMKIPFSLVLQKIKEVAKRCDILLIEGAGGLLAPLGEGYTLADLIRKLGGMVIVTARNQLGTINHTLLTVKFLQKISSESGRKQRVRPSVIQSLGIKVVLMNAASSPELSSRSNGQILSELLAPVPVFTVPFLGRNPSRLRVVRNLAKKLKRTLAQITSR